MRVVILGCGRVGSELARMLSGDGHQVAVIDLKTEAFRRLGSAFKVETIVGTGIDPDTLIRAGIQQCDVFAACTEGDNRNIMSALVAKKMFEVKTVLVRIYDPRRTEIYRETGLETICPTLVGAAEFYKVIAHGDPMVSMSVDGGQHQIVEWLLGDDHGGQKIRSLRIPDDATVAALIRDGNAAVPLSDTVLQAGDRLIILTKTTGIGEMRALMNGANTR